jgi:hypothetical protein
LFKSLVVLTLPSAFSSPADLPDEPSKPLNAARLPLPPDGLSMPGTSLANCE